MSNHKSNRFFSGKGYYIALILCAAAIGISGYVYYQNAGEAPADTLDAEVIATTPTSGTVTTQPGLRDEETNPTETTKATEPKAGKMSVTAPVEGEVISGYAMEVLSYNQTTRAWRVHNGVDSAAEAGTEVGAAAAGEVYTVYEDGEMGTTVVIRHENGYVTKYASLASEVSVSPGDAVEMGQTIGTVGSTALMETALGDHLHFSVTCNNESVDPEEFLNQ